MGKIGAYLSIDRQNHNERPVRVRTKDYAEIALPLTEELQRLQASRCMMCGVAFCQAGIAFGDARPSGCPLHNLIPEWNDLVYRGLWQDAAERMALTNPFPEFTGRVCPALCEASCNLGLNEGPTTIRDNERAISDRAWELGVANTLPLPVPAADAPRVAVLGAGPAGLATAWALTARGVAVTVFDEADRAGGLLMYGIPNMKLPKDIIARRIKQMEASGITFVYNVKLSSGEDVQNALGENVFDACVIATGARRARRLSCPGSDAPQVVLAVDYLTAATKSLFGEDKTKVQRGTETHEEPLATPRHISAIDAAGKDVVVIGGGDTGTDCVATALRQGAKSVVQFEFLPEPPARRTSQNAWPEWPAIKKTDYGQNEAAVLEGGDPRTWATNTLEVLLNEQGDVRGLKVVSLDWSEGKPVAREETTREIPAQLVLIAMGFSGPDPEIFEALGCTIHEERGGIRPVCSAGTHQVDANQKNVFVAGDARSGSSLVVNAIADGLACAAEVAISLGK